MRQTTWTPVYFIAQLFYFIALVRTALLTAALTRQAAAAVSVGTY